MYDDLRKVMGVVPGRALLVEMFTGEGENLICFTLSHV